MSRRMSWITIIFVAIFFLFGCESNQEGQIKEEETSITVLPNTSYSAEVEEQTVELEDHDGATELAEIELSGEIVNKNGRVIVNGKSNLLEGTKVDMNWLERPFSIRNPICLLCDKEAVVDKDGNFTYEIPTDLHKYGHILVTIQVSPVGQTYKIKTAYGKHGENFKGPFVSKHEILNEEYQRIYSSVLVLPGGEQTEYPIEAPKREEVPDDYGSTNVWLETELTNDHDYFYIKGKSNLLEGTKFSAVYYSSKDAVLAQNWVPSTAHVVSDGIILLQIPYDTITENGYLILTAKPEASHLRKTKMKQLYGENFENMSGEQVVPNEEEGNKIEVILYLKPPIVNAPDETRVTTDGDETKIQLPDNILFDYDQSDLKPDAKNTLNQLLQSLEALEAGTVMHINGHTDSEGDDQYNITLSEKRAKSVEAFLLQSGKVNHIEITTTGYGETMPLASNESEEGKAKNRRVEIVINPK